MKRKISSKDIAVCGVSAALSLTFAALAFYVDALNVTFSVLSAAALMMPLASKRYMAGVLCCVAVALLLLVLTSPVGALPYAVVFGGYTVFTCIAADKKWNVIAVYVAKVVWINAALALFYLGTKTLVVNFDKLGFEIKYGYLAVIVTVLGIVYDFLLLYLYKVVKDLSAKYLGKYVQND